MDLEKSLLPTSETYFGTTPKDNVLILFNNVNSVARSDDGIKTTNLYTAIMPTTMPLPTVLPMVLKTTISVRS